MKQTKIFKALDRSQLEAFVQQWLTTLKPTPQILSTAESVVTASVPHATAQGMKNKRRQVLQLKVAYVQETEKPN